MDINDKLYINRAESHYQSLSVHVTLNNRFSHVSPVDSSISGFRKQNEKNNIQIQILKRYAN